MPNPLKNQGVAATSALPRTSRGERGYQRFARSASEDQRPLKIQRGLGPDVLNPPLAVSTQPVETQTIGSWVDQSDQPGAQYGPLCRINLALKY